MSDHKHKPSRQRYTWTEGDKIVVHRDEGLLGDTVIRRFWVQSPESNIREVTDRTPGVLGREICVGLEAQGHALRATPETLKYVIQREYRRVLANRKRWST